MAGKFLKVLIQKKLDLPLTEMLQQSIISLEEVFCKLKQKSAYCVIPNKSSYLYDFLNIFLRKYVIFKYQLKKLSL